jgi:hypothetical protein
MRPVTLASGFRAVLAPHVSHLHKFRMQNGSGRGLQMDDRHGMRRIITFSINRLLQEQQGNSAGETAPPAPRSLPPTGRPSLAPPCVPVRGLRAAAHPPCFRCPVHPWPHPSSYTLPAATRPRLGFCSSFPPALLARICRKGSAASQCRGQATCQVRVAFIHVQLTASFTPITSPAITPPPGCPTGAISVRGPPMHPATNLLPTTRSNRHHNKPTQHLYITCRQPSPHLPHACMRRSWPH